MMTIRKTTLRVAAVLAILSAGGFPLLAASPAPPSKDQRDTMAQAHEKMAACLRSDRPIEDCRQDMMQACHDTMGAQGCGMMMGQGGMRGRGMMRGQSPNQNGSGK
jgi:hypothetical protein